MANQVDPRFAYGRQASAAQDFTFDAGLRSHMLKIYNYMASGVLLTGLVALAVAHSSLGQLFYAQLPNGRVAPTMLGFVAMFSPLVMILVMSFGINRLSTAATQAMFWAFAALMGVSMANIFYIYTDSSIAQTFFVTAAAFAGLSLWGYTTKRDLSGMGRFLVMGLIGILVAMLANLFFQSGPLQLAINILGVLIFSGLTAYDTQRLREEYAYLQGAPDYMGKAAVMGALSLYLNFINLFQFLLSFLGNRE